MKRPEKKKPHTESKSQAEWFRGIGYNQACQEWETFLPDEEELYELIFDVLFSDKIDKFLEIKDKLADRFDGVAGYSEATELLVQAISARLKGKQ